MRHRARAADEWLRDKFRWIILALALFSVVQLAYFSYNSRSDAEARNRVSGCQAKYNESVSKAIRERAIFAQQDRDSMVTFIREVAAAKTPKQSRASLNKYLKTQDDIDEARKDHPIPALPPGRCS